MESSKFMVSADIPVDIKKLEAATDQLYELIDKGKIKAQTFCFCFICLIGTVKI